MYDQRLCKYLIYIYKVVRNHQTHLVGIIGYQDSLVVSGLSSRSDDRVL